MISSASRRIASRLASRSSGRRVLSTSLRTTSVLRRAVAHPQRFYTTEAIVKLRSGLSKEDQPKHLYDANYEKENCGVGLIASLKSIPSRKIVDRADEMLVRMAHRGGVSVDPASGDGAGT
jgi:hypothetical protein